MHRQIDVHVCVAAVQPLHNRSPVLSAAKATRNVGDVGDVGHRRSVGRLHILLS